MSVAAPQQVMLEVRFVEVSRQGGARSRRAVERVQPWACVANIGSRQAPTNLPITAPTSSTNIPAGEVAAGVLSGTSPFGFALARMINGGTAIDVLLNALEQKGVARRLWLSRTWWLCRATPRASWPAASIPVPVSSTLGQVTDRIQAIRRRAGLHADRAEPRPDQSEDRAGGEPARSDPHRCRWPSNITVPPLIVRRASTTLELRDGQSFVIGGLLQNINSNDQQQLPWLGDVPVLGALFRSASYQKNETDLAIIVTPRIVRPARPGDVDQDPARQHPCRRTTSICSCSARTEVPRRGKQAECRRRGIADVGHILDLPKRGWPCRPCARLDCWRWRSARSCF